MLAVTVRELEPGNFCQACPQDLNQNPIWEIRFDNGASVALCFFHIGQLTEELNLILKHAVYDSRFTLGKP